MSVHGTGRKAPSGYPAGIGQKILSGVMAALTVAMAGMTPVQAADGDLPRRADGKPVYRAAPPQVQFVPVGPPTAIITDPAGSAYVVPAPAYQPGSEYFQGPVLVDATRYYRNCWWEWGYYRCALIPRWFVSPPR